MNLKLNLPRIPLNDKTGSIILVIISICFTALNLTFIYYNNYLFALLPLLLVIAYLYFTNLKFVFFLTILSTPLSFNLVFEDMNMGINVPSEPLLLGIMVLFIFKLLYERPLNRKELTHPISIFIFLQLGWMLITVLTSQLPLISAKYFLMQLWFVIPVFLFGQLILRSKKDIYLFFLLIIIGISITVIYTTIHHAMNGFAEKSGNWVMQPFYNDHTAYGAILAMVLPVVAGMAFFSKLEKYTRIYLTIATLLFLTGIFLSFSRATWLSVAISLVFLFILVYRVKFKWIFSGLVVAGFILFLNYDNLMQKLEKNKQDSSAHFVEHVQSITNIKTDASNLERINRWKAAFRMFEEFPVFGTGPGTYQFLYAPYQKSKDRTIVSTNAGDLGNAHSEYISPLVERGVPGLIFFLSIVISVYIIGIRTYRRLRDKELKMVIAVILTGMFSYLMHGFLNNFLDTDHASVVFWGFIAIIVQLSIFSKSEANNKEVAE